jgi:hypothetical protein
MSAKRIVATGITIVDANGTGRLTIQCDPIEGQPRISFLDSNGCERLLLTVAESGSPLINVFDADTYPVIGITANSAHAVLRIYDSEGRPKVDLEATAESVSVSAHEPDVGKTVLYEYRLGKIKRGHH